MREKYIVVGCLPIKKIADLKSCILTIDQITRTICIIYAACDFLFLPKKIFLVMTNMF